MKHVSKPAKDLIQKILLTDEKRITTGEIFNDQWVLKETSKVSIKVSFAKLSNFSKFSKVPY